MPNLQLDLLAKDNATPAIKGMTGALLNANIAMAALQQIVGFATNAMGNAIKSNQEMQKTTNEITVNVNALAISLSSMFVGSLNGGLKAVRDFVNESKNIQAIGGYFAILIDIGKKLGKEVFEFFIMMSSPFLEFFDGITKKSDGAARGVNLLAIAGQLLGDALKISASFMKINISATVDFIKICIEAAQVFGTLKDVITGKAKWKDVGDALLDVGKAAKQMGVDLVNNTKDAIFLSIDTVKKLPQNSKKAMEDEARIYKEGGQTALDEYRKAQAQILQAQEERLKKQKDAEKQALIKEGAQTWKQWADLVGKIVTDALSSIQQAMSNYYESQIALMEENKEKNIEAVDDWMNQELESRGAKQESQAEILQNEIDALNKQMDKSKNAKQRQLLNEQKLEKQKELDRIRIAEEGAKRKEEIDAETKKKETALKKKTFEENKIFSIVNIWLAAGMAVMAAWQGMLTAVPGPGGLALAIATSAAAIVMAGVQTGIVASQQFVAEQGGVVPGMSFSGDKINVGINSMERVLTPEQNRAFEQLVFNGGFSGGGININAPIYVSANNGQEFIDSLAEIARQERGRK